MNNYFKLLGSHRNTKERVEFLRFFDDRNVVEIADTRHELEDRARELEEDGYRVRIAVWRLCMGCKGLIQIGCDPFGMFVQRICSECEKAQVTVSTVNLHGSQPGHKPYWDGTLVEEGKRIPWKHYFDDDTDMYTDETLLAVVDKITQTRNEWLVQEGIPIVEGLSASLGEFDRRKN